MGFPHPAQVRACTLTCPYLCRNNSPLTTGQHRWYKFTPTETRRYVLTTSGTLDTVGELYQGETLLSFDDDSGAGSNFLIERDLTAGTEYRLKVKGANSSVSGSFSLKVDRLYYASVYNYYDYNYNEKVGGNDTTTSANNINSYRTWVNAIFSTAFNLRITNNTTTLFQSYGDIHNGNGTINDINDHFREWLGSNSTNPHSAVLWTGCSDGQGVTYLSRATIGIGENFTWNDWSGVGSCTADEHTKYLYLHELGHTMGANGDSSCPALQPCIMSYNTGWSDTFTLIRNNSADDYFCDQCKQQILNTISDY